MIPVARLILKIALPLLVLAVSVVIATNYLANKPEPFKRPQFQSVTSVEAMRVQKSDFPVVLSTQGSVKAVRQSALAAQVGGVINSLDDNFVNGGFFSQGDVLAQIDARDYEIALTTAKAGYAQASATLAEEQARGEQASLDWKRLGRKGKPSSLTLREPQLAAASASLASAQAQIDRARLDLERTSIVAPYDGRVVDTNVGEGQFVQKGGIVANIYSTDSAEVRLPLGNRQLGFVDLPQQSANGDDATPVTLSARIGGVIQEWGGAIVRTEGTIDQANRQLYVIARIDNPYPSDENAAALQMGQFVQASVTGKTLRDVFVIPRSALREDREVLLVTDEGTLQRREVSVRWKNAEVAVISDGIQQGDVISLTTLGTVVNGTRVKASIDGKSINSEPQQQTSNNIPVDGERAARMKRLKAMVDAGEEIPPFVRDRIQARIDAGQPVPDWLRAALAKPAN